MAQQTTHFDMVKQQSAEHVSVGLLNDNFDIIDQVMYNNQEKSEQLADEYNAGTTYNVGDYVRRENYIYKCNTASTTGVWDSTKWDRVKVMDEITQGGGGGSSTLAGLDDVNISSPTDGQALVYDNATGKWVNGAGGGGSSTFAGLNDVNVQGVSNGDIARYNSTTGKWTDSSDLTDLELTVAQLQASVLEITDGHTILDSNGTAMAQEDGLQFVGSNVADDSTNGKTVVTTNIDIEQADYDALVANDADLPGVNYNITDAQPVAVNASNLPYDSTHSVADMIDLNESEDVSDWIQLSSGITLNSGSIIRVAKHIYYIYLDCRGNVSTAVANVGTVKKALLSSATLAGRFTTTNWTDSPPATGLMLSNGDLRLIATAPSVAFVLAGFFIA